MLGNSYKMAPCTCSHKSLFLVCFIHLRAHSTLASIQVDIFRARKTLNVFFWIFTQKKFFFVKNPFGACSEIYIFFGKNIGYFADMFKNFYKKEIFLHFIYFLTRETLFGANLCAILKKCFFPFLF